MEINDHCKSSANQLLTESPFHTFISQYHQASLNTFSQCYLRVIKVSLPESRSFLFQTDKIRCSELVNISQMVFMLILHACTHTQIIARQPVCWYASLLIMLIIIISLLPYSSSICLLHPSVVYRLIMRLQVLCGWENFLVICLHAVRKNGLMLSMVLLQFRRW